MKATRDEILDVVGVGIGPFNLSVAALMAPLKGLNGLFFERSSEFQWHPGFLFPEATIQVSFLKDLVTLADPGSPYSFLSFLFAKKRLYRFLHANFPKVMRREFNQYLRWVCDSLPNLRFNQEVQSIRLEGSHFEIELKNERRQARHLILGTGHSPKVPDCARPHLGDTVFHSNRYLEMGIQPKGKRVALIGGGQSGAEMLYHLLQDEASLPREITWITRRSNFLPLDDSPFVNELFAPAYSNFFFSLSKEGKRRLVEEQRLASDGISMDLLQGIYRRLYSLELLDDAGRFCRLQPECHLVDLERSAGGWALATENRLTGNLESKEVDLVILCTGFEYRIPEYLGELRDRLRFEGGNYCFRDDFSIEWDGPSGPQIFVQNAARHCRGVADPNLSLMAWRSATILNSLAGQTVYDIEEASSAFDWPVPEEAYSLSPSLAG